MDDKKRIRKLKRKVREMEHVHRGELVIASEHRARRSMDPHDTRSAVEIYNMGGGGGGGGGSVARGTSSFTKVLNASLIHYENSLRANLETPLWNLLHSTGGRRRGKKRSYRARHKHPR